MFVICQQQIVKYPSKLIVFVGSQLTCIIASLDNPDVPLDEGVVGGK